MCFGPERAQIAFECPRIARQVGRIVELSRVDEDADERAVVFSAAAPDERQVPLVQRAHGRHEPEGDACPDLGTALVAPRGEVVERRGHE